MSRKTAGFILFSIAILTFSAEVLASGGVLNFRGQVVESSCDVRHLFELKTLKQVQLIQVLPRVTLVLDRYRNACSGDVMAFDISLVGGIADENPAASVVIVTYQ
ncbi:hypothetical protein QN382_09950 [Pseudomonas sp. 10B1]|uniref:hypothetical protein n=2 Tax=Pseudomonas TaxID=286 RepID=UPI002AB4F2AC|nr:MULTISPECIES: hypothetical protein [unclassified Pseudomonas]MDY7559165.1 hypothetical protein [Pseudomonas sp. AB6]MEA9978778.1 hypothetical protein [Pseudomonas sp. RTS4]MEA9994241.1 hypothetical protein [Pseudomonas sp. AA4]MEB0086124.1 hypothetical protein [Pseudomonas sp. RTI1]MEB0124912.1 hypothetical protein [Pseudomonas sp. CCC1.2]